MEAVIRASSISFPSIQRRHLIFASKHCTRLHIPSSSACIVPGSSKRRLLISSASTGLATAITREEEKEEEEEREKFAWYEEWYPVAPVCDLDKRRPHGKKVMGLEVVVWWDRNEEAWKVFDDNCPHRLAPLSEGRIDGKGRLQCVYHGWCFGGGGDCKYIPQAPRDGPPVHSSSKACAGVYPSCVQNKILWFWPNIISTTDDDEKLKKKKPPYIPELDDPSYTNGMSSREAPYSYEILVENLVDPAHVPYAHHRILRIFDKPTTTASTHDHDRDKEGGGPLRLDVGRITASGFTAKLGDTTTTLYTFKAPCLYSASYYLDDERKMKAVLVFLCVPVSPGSSRLIFSLPRNFGVWMDRIIPRWVYHIGENMVFDSDLQLLMVEEKRLKAVGSLNWNRTCYVPTKADAMVVSFRRWLNTYAGARVGYKQRDNDDENASLLLPCNREQLFDRYWSHTVKCSSCSLAYKCLTALHLALQLVSVASLAIAAVAAPRPGYKHLISVAAVLCFVASKWLSHFVYKTFRYHDYDHAFH